MDVEKLKCLGVISLEHHLCRITNAAKDYFFYHETGEFLDGSEVNSMTAAYISRELLSALLDLSLEVKVKNDNSRN